MEIHLKQYPLMEPQDFGKLAFQSEFGPEHMVFDGKLAWTFLKEEWMALSRDNSYGILQGRQEVIWEISESLCRFPISLCESVDEAKLLAHLFIATAKEHRGTVEGLEKKLELLKELHIPNMEAWTADWKSEGYPPVHHSRIYRDAYQPHYRLIKKEYGDYFHVLFEIYRLIQRKDSAVIAIDGRCGSGKTYLAALIEKLFDCNILHMDDFYLPPGERGKDWMEIPGGNMDLKRFLTEALRPLRLGQEALYRPYNCIKNNMGEAVRVPFRKLTVVEGSYSHHPILAGEYDLKIFLTCSREEQRKRLRMREGDYFSAFENMWIPLEENYLKHYSIEAKSHLIVDTGNY